MTEKHDDPGAAEEARGPDPAREPAPQPAHQEPPEVQAEPFDAQRDKGPTIDARDASAGTEKKASRKTLLPILCHLAPLLQIVFYLPGINVLAPLLVWQLGKADPEVDDQGRESVNFQINVLGLSLILTFSCIGIVLIPVLLAVAIVMVIVAAAQASEGKRYRYPFIFRLLRP